MNKIAKIISIFSLVGLIMFIGLTFAFPASAAGTQTSQVPKTTPPATDPATVPADTKTQSTVPNTSTTTNTSASAPASDQPGYVPDQRGGFVICGNVASNPCTLGHLFRAFILIINYLITMAGFVAVAAIIFAGIKMVASQGGPGYSEAVGRLSGAVIGLVLVATAFVIINTIFAGSLSVGLKNGAMILTSPSDYINQSETDTTGGKTPTGADAKMQGTSDTKTPAKSSKTTK